MLGGRPWPARCRSRPAADPDSRRKQAVLQSMVDGGTGFGTRQIFISMMAPSSNSDVRETAAAPSYGIECHTAMASTAIHVGCSEIRAWPGRIGTLLLMLALSRRFRGDAHARSRSRHPQRHRGDRSRQRALRCRRARRPHRRAGGAPAARPRARSMRAAGWSCRAASTATATSSSSPAWGSGTPTIS